MSATTWILISLLFCAGPISPTKKDFQYKPLQNSVIAETLLKSNVAVLDVKYPFPALRLKQVSGSGTIVRLTKNKKIQILTAWHVAKHLLDTGGIGFARIYHPESDIEVKIVAKDEKNDLALLESLGIYSGSPDVVATVATTAPKRGDRVWAAGAPDRRELSVTSGVLVTETPCEETPDNNCYVFDAAIFFGSSGGGLFDANGKLIGVTLFVNADSFKDHLGAERNIIQPGASGAANWYVVNAFLQNVLGDP